MKMSPVLNATLLEFLKRDFDLTLPELEGELPTDESGIDVPRVFDLMRARVRDVPGFEVIEEIAISTFSFAKYLMWKDLVDRTDDLRNNRLVAHLVDNPENAFETGLGDPIQPEELDARISPKDLVTPLPADSSQLAAVAAAVEGRDFVLIGPPGTGKSQTIANIICQCLAHGKTVLFVAEKAAALDVVHRRLEAHGLGDAILELHSNKTDRKRVLNQLGRGWDRASGQGEESWIEINDKLKIERDRLNEYVEALHSKGTQGFSIFDALGWTAAEPRGFTLSFNEKDAHDETSFARLIELASSLERTHSATSDIPPFALIDEGDWSFAWQSEILEALSWLRVATDRVSSAARSVANSMGLADHSMSEERAVLFDQFAERVGEGVEDVTDVPEMTKQDLEAAVEGFRARVEELQRERSALSAEYEEEEVRECLLNSWMRIGARPVRPSGPSRRSAGAEFARYCKAMLKVDLRHPMVTCGRCVGCERDWRSSPRTRSFLSQEIKDRQKLPRRVHGRPSRCGLPWRGLQTMWPTV